MKSLTEHNANRRREIASTKRQYRNGIACPLCGAELIDSIPGDVVTTDPPQKHVECQECSFTGLAVL